ncbi:MULTISPECIES: M61 family metallopeptidase [unclassified Colwellia]|uniref:M61 family metallopeptidase n=1 Tax=unclassified Colwellia TaxID=196834 RepID=UPI0015F44EC4|nr:MULTISPECIES: hypothetical protein [unclassified Colwellia]MBA6231633.1 hypothetical protein [Colwellia sp. MB02u-7]MBA6235497.1 hypothetical protein [Colwellia sp. MB02u-11]MBA6258051.1 hypothetical protein [Colwellia sp. MB3u-28]MBA6259745.1 hypothetical protein [Colwellia sp. MB3u-41]MBA6299829.1 hypothetical protein [Colwellia sp. MB3u-22]
MFYKYALNYPVLSITLLLILFTRPASAKSNEDNTYFNQNIDVRFQSNISSDKKEILRQWINHSSDALTLVYGELPVDHFITKIKFSKRDSGVVPWGEVSRNTIPEVTLVVNPKSTLNELKADWTIYHEFSHLLIPYDAADSRWFSEGLASYYQNIIQARAGMFNESKMWQKLYEGFERGRKDTKYNHQKLNYLSDNINQNHSYMRVYWSGALYWLKADIALRKLKSGYSLDKALHELHKCCFDRYLSAGEITKQLDKLTNNNIFTSLFTEFSKSYILPKYMDDLNMLGIEQQAGRVILGNKAENSHIRRAIFTGK